MAKLMAARETGATRPLTYGKYQHDPKTFPFGSLGTGFLQDQVGHEALGDQPCRHFPKRLSDKSAGLRTARAFGKRKEEVTLDRETAKALEHLDASTGLRVDMAHNVRVGGSTNREALDGCVDLSRAQFQIRKNNTHGKPS